MTPAESSPTPETIQVQVQGVAYVWTPENGLDPAVVNSCTGFVHREAKRFREVGESIGLSMEDLLQEGYVGLLQAARRFDPRRGFHFLTYAGWWVLQAQLSALRHRGVRLPARDHDRRAKANTLPAVCSLDAPASSGEPRWTLLANGSDHQDEILLRNEQDALVAQGVARLPHRLRAILVRRYGLKGDPEPLGRIGMDMGISRERVRQLQILAENRLRRMLASLHSNPEEVR